MIRNQFGRRNLEAYQRAELALQLEPLIAKRAKANQRERKGAQPGATKQNLAELNTRAEIAKAAHVSHDTIHKARATRRSPAFAGPNVRKAAPFVTISGSKSGAYGPKSGAATDAP